MTMRKRELERLLDLLGTLSEQPGLTGSEKDEVSHIRFVLGEVLDGERDLR